MAEISVIVPVYNCEKYLPECVRSILNQSERDFELLLVDDGSTDQSPKICDAIAAQDCRVRVIHQRNCGVSCARNRGIEEASGTFIAFVDADDVIHPQYLELLLKGIRQSGTMLSICTFQSFPHDGQMPIESVAQPAVRYMTRRELLALLNDWCNVEALSMVIPCVKLYRAELLREIRFPEGIRHEDEFFAHHILAKCEEAVFLDIPLYGYRQNPDSYMNRNVGNVDFSHLSRVDALVERIALYKNIEPTLVSGAVHHLLRECNSFYDLYGGENRKKCTVQRKWLVDTYRRAYRQYFSMLDRNERLKGGLFALFPECYRLLAKRKYHSEATA